MASTTVIALFLQYKYIALVVLACLEGPYIMMMSGFLVHLGVLSLAPTFIALSIGDLIGDTIWYFIGYYFGNGFIRRFGKLFDISEEHIDNIKDIFLRHRRKVLLGSKVTAGFGLSISTLLMSGMARVPLFEFILLNFFGQLSWTATMMAVGYFFGGLYVTINNVVGRVFLIMFALIALFLFLRFVRHIGRSARQRLR